MLFHDLPVASSRAAATSKRNDKVARLVEVLRSVADDELELAVWFLTGHTPLGRIGVGWSTLADVRPEPAVSPSLTISDVERALRAIEETTGPGRCPPVGGAQGQGPSAYSSGGPHGARRPIQLDDLADL